MCNVFDCINPLNIKKYEIRILKQIYTFFRIYPKTSTGKSLFHVFNILIFLLA